MTYAVKNTNIDVKLRQIKLQDYDTLQFMAVCCNRENNSASIGKIFDGSKKNLLNYPADRGFYLCFLLINSFLKRF